MLKALVGVGLLALVSRTSVAQTAYAEVYKWHWFGESAVGFSQPPVEDHKAELKWSTDGSLPITEQQEDLWPANQIGQLCNQLREDDTYWVQWTGPLTSIKTDWAKCGASYAYNEGYHNVSPDVAINHYCVTGYHANYQVLDAQNTHQTRICDGQYRIRVAGGVGHTWRVRIAYNLERIDSYPGNGDGQGCDTWNFQSTTHPNFGTTIFTIGGTSNRIGADGTAYVVCNGNSWVDIHPATTDSYFKVHFRYSVTVMGIEDLSG